MGLVEGETLAHRIARGPIPLDEAPTITKQIANALEAVHDGTTGRELTGGRRWPPSRPLFAGDTVVETLAAVVDQDPDLTAPPPHGG